MTTITALLAALVLSGFQDPPAQEGDGGDGGGRRPRRTEFSGGGFQFGQQQTPEQQAAQRAEWLKTQLGLTDEQIQKVTQIYKESSEAEKKVETDRQAKIRETLTDDQKKKYDEMLAAMNRPRTPMSGLESMMDGWADTLKKELSLDDATAAKIKPIIDDFRKKIQERGEKFRAEGMQGVNWGEEMQKFRDGMKEAGEKVKEHLTPEQKDKFDKLVERYQGGRGGFGMGGERRGPPTPEERATRVMDQLKIADAAEATAVKTALLKVLESENALRDFERDTRGKIEELSKDNALTEDQVNTRLNDLKKGRQERDRAHKDAQTALRDIITARQEVELIRQGVFR
jgi:Spy/CpxP family protein refolding chaperone